MDTTELLLHPVRLRIIEAFLGERALTTSQLKEELPEVSPASLYRQVALLVERNVLQIVAEKRVRGTFERTYVLRVPAATVSLDDVAKMSREDHRHAFIAFIAGLVGDFDRYLARDHIDLLTDGVSYGLAGLWLTDEEVREFLLDLTRVIQPRLTNTEQPGRRRRILGTVTMPGTNQQ